MKTFYRFGRIPCGLVLMLTTLTLCAADALVLRQAVGNLAGSTLSIPGETSFTYPATSGARRSFRRYRSRSNRGASISVT